MAGADVAEGYGWGCTAGTVAAGAPCAGCGVRSCWAAGARAPWRRPDGKQACRASPKREKAQAGRPQARQPEREPA